VAGGSFIRAVRLLSTTSLTRFAMPALSRFNKGPISTLRHPGTSEDRVYILSMH
jgi:hypothetical protein